MNRSRYFPGALAAVALTVATGCGPSLAKFKGVVKLDGTPVEGATVAFVAADGNTSYTGLSDASGTFTLTGADGKPGVPSGTYKVTVVKHAALQGGEAAGPGSPEYMKQMASSAKEAAKEGGFKGGMMPGMPRPGTAGGHEKTELPTVYASATSTPLTVTVPPPADPVPIELKSKP